MDLGGTVRIRDKTKPLAGSIVATNANRYSAAKGNRLIARGGADGERELVMARLENARVAAVRQTAGNEHPECE